MDDQAFATAPDDIVTDEAGTSRVEHFELPQRPLEESDLARLSLPSRSLKATKDNPAVIFATAVRTSELTVCNTYPVILVSSGEDWSLAGSQDKMNSWYWEDIWTTADRDQIWAALLFHCESSNGQVMLIHSPDGGRTWGMLATVPLGNYNTTGYDTFQLAPDGNATLVGSWYDDGYGVPCPASPKEAVNGFHEACRGVILKESSDGGRTWEKTRAFHGSFHRLQARIPSVVHSFIDYDYLELDKLKQCFGPAPAPIAQSRLPGAESVAFDEALMARATAVTRFNRPFLEVPESEPSDSMIPYLLDTGNRDRQEGRLIRLPYPGYQWTAMGPGSWAGILQKDVTDMDDTWVVQCLNPTREWTAGKLPSPPTPPYTFDSLVELQNGALELHVRLLPGGRKSDDLGRVIFSSTDEGRSWTRSRFEADILVPLPGLEYPQITTQEEADKQLLRIMEEAVADVTEGSPGS